MIARVDWFDLPQIGQQVYMDSFRSVFDDQQGVVGGLCTIVKIEYGISAGRRVPFVGVKEIPRKLYNWELLQEQQDRLGPKYGNRRAKVL